MFLNMHSDSAFFWRQILSYLLKNNNNIESSTKQKSLTFFLSIQKSFVLILKNKFVNDF